MSAKFNQNTIALVYDFDGTLSPRTMYDYTVLPQLDLEPTKFWREVKRETIKNHVSVANRTATNTAQRDGSHARIR